MNINDIKSKNYKYDGLEIKDTAFLIGRYVYNYNTDAIGVICSPIRKTESLGKEKNLYIYVRSIGKNSLKTKGEKSNWWFNISKLKEDNILGTTNLYILKNDLFEIDEETTIKANNIQINYMK